MADYIDNPLDCYFSDRTPLEKITGAGMVVDSNHGQVHAGNAFSLPALKEAVAAGGTFIVSIDVPAGAYVHFQAANIQASGHAKIELLEGVTVGTEGTAILPLNRHRIINKASVLTCRTDDTLSDDGVTMSPFVTGAPGVPSKADAGGETGDRVEWVLNPGVTYAFRVTSKEASDEIDISIQPFWYEESAA